MQRLNFRYSIDATPSLVFGRFRRFGLIQIQLPYCEYPTTLNHFKYCGLRRYLTGRVGSSDDAEMGKYGGLLNVYGIFSGPGSLEVTCFFGLKFPHIVEF